jgi:hypothetical protein
MDNNELPQRGCVVAVAGRRIDADGAYPPRFPLANVPLVRKRLVDLLMAENAVAVVCSAACGADLMALEAAGELGLRRRVVLPFGPERFRETSVVDRPGVWSEIYDRVIAEVEATGDLVVLPSMAGNDSDAYQAANKAIIQEAVSLAGATQPMAVVVWEGTPRSDSDATEAFRALAENAGFSLSLVQTL